MSFGRLVTTNIIFRGLNIVAGFLITILFTRLAGAEGYGVISLIIANATIFNLATCLGSDSGIAYHYASGSISSKKIFFIIYSIIFFQLLLLFVVEIIYHKFTGHYWLINGKTLIFLLLGLAYLLNITVIDKYTAFLNAAHQYAAASRIIFFCNLIGLLVMASFFFFDKQKSLLFFIQLYIGWTFLQAATLFTGFHLITKRLSLLGKTKIADWKLFFSYSFVAFVTNLIQFFAYRIDYWIVNYYKGKQALGLYSLSVKIGQAFWILPLILASMIFPLVADKGRNFNAQKITTIVRIMNAISIIGIVATLLVADMVIPIIFGEEFKDSIRPLFFMLPGMLFFNINIILAAYFAGKNYLKINLIGSGICFLIILLLDLLLIPLYGIEGAAIADSIAYTASALYSIVIFLKTENKTVKELLFIQKKDLEPIRKWYYKITQL